MTGEDPREAMLHLHSTCLQRPVLIGHGPARSQGGSSELMTFLVDLSEA